MNTIFDQNLKKEAPLADRMRPRDFSEFAGQEQIVGEGKILRRLIEKDELPSMIFWGPPGSGKTTLARVIAQLTKSVFVQLSATSSGVKEVREVIKEAEKQKSYFNRRTILFIDEIHRFNKAQQDAFLPCVEAGVVILIGATTENPSFEVNSALLSRVRVFVLKPLAPADIEKVVKNALADKERGLGNYQIKLNPEALAFLIQGSNGDARVALNTLEIAVKATGGRKDLSEEIIINADLIKESLQKTFLIYDKDGEEHYNLISALHKSLRGSDADASLYWLGRILEAGEDPLYVARRLVRFASEDVGMADPGALVQAVCAYQACHFIGMPECNVILAQVVVYLAKAPKSNALYEAYNQVVKDVEETLNQPVPLHLRNAPTGLMKELGYGQGYKYNPDYKEPVAQDYLPAGLKGRKYYQADKK